jgi:chromosome segregation ATPase
MPQEQPKAHVTQHSMVLSMLEKLRTDVGAHLEQVRGEWTIEENRLNSILETLEGEISTLKIKIKDDTETMETKRADVLAADQKMHGLQLEIESDSDTLKTTTERADKAKQEYEADKTTRLSELQAISNALRVLV